MADHQQTITLTADIVAAHVSNNRVAVGDVANLVQQVHQALVGLEEPAPEMAPKKKQPAVSARASVKPDFITCMDCGKRQKMLKRHLQNAHGMTPDQYRAEFGLPASYPMTAPNYSQQRQEMAKRIGLGRKPAAAEAASPKRTRAKRAPKAEAPTE